jgi:hypothetical protein
MLHRVESAPAKHGHPTNDFFCCGVEGIRMLKERVCSKNSKNENFVSWTSPLVFALQHAICKSAGGEDPSTIKIMVVNTHMVDRGLFIPITGSL